MKREGPLLTHTGVVVVVCGVYLTGLIVIVILTAGRGGTRYLHLLTKQHKAEIELSNSNRMTIFFIAYTPSYFTRVTGLSSMNESSRMVESGN